jgi:hypothetical protein
VIDAFKTEELTEELVELKFELESLEEETEDESLQAESVIKPKTKQIENLCFFILKIIPRIED